MLEFPKMLYGPAGEIVVVDDAEQEAAQLDEWEIATTAALLTPTAEEMTKAVDALVAKSLSVVVDAPRKRGRPLKAR